MDSPFPGMDPWLEAHWGDVHTRLIMYSADALESLLPPGFYARVEERVFVDAPEGRHRVVYPDVRVTERPTAAAVVGTSGLALAEPAVIHWPDEPVTERFIEIHEAGSRDRVITVIEILSPSNKRPGDGQDLYLKKQRECRDGQVSLVEIDLLRGGRFAALPPAAIPESHRTHYRAYVDRGWDWKNVSVHRIPLRERLPALPIPLRELDEDVLLDLQSVLRQAYRKGRYGETIDYSAEPDPPLDPNDATWADQLLRQAGLR